VHGVVLKAHNFSPLMVALNIAPNVLSRIWYRIRDVFNDIDFNMLMKTSSYLPIGLQLRHTMCLNREAQAC
jgi:hypothetical protein